MIGTPYEEIMKKYPKLFSNLSYVECADGWADLIDKVSRRIHLINNSYENKEDGVFAAQIKEKFGGLRYYVDINGLLELRFGLLKKMIKSPVELVNETLRHSCS